MISRHTKIYPLHPTYIAFSAPAKKMMLHPPGAPSERWENQHIPGLLKDSESQSSFLGLISSPVCNETTAKLPMKTSPTSRIIPAVRSLISSSPSMKPKLLIIQDSFLAETYQLPTALIRILSSQSAPSCCGGSRNARSTCSIPVKPRSPRGVRAGSPPISFGATTPTTSCTHP